MDGSGKWETLAPNAQRKRRFIACIAVGPIDLMIDSLLENDLWCLFVFNVEVLWAKRNHDAAS